MTVVGALVMAAGLGLMVVSPILALLGWGSSRDRRRLERTPRRTCAELLGVPRGRCLVVGEVRAGPSGLQTAPICEVEVAWHRTRVWRRYQTWDMEHENDELVWEHANTGPFALHDATGSVLVNPLVFDPDTAAAPALDHPATEEIADEYERSDRRKGHHGGPALQALADRGLLPPSALQRAGERATRGYRVQELVLRAHQPVSVVATPARKEGGVVLQRPRRGRSLVSSRTPEALRTAREEDARDGYGYAAWFLANGAILLLVGWLLAVVLPGNAVLG